MATKTPPIFVPGDTRLFVQEDGPGNPYRLYPCHAVETADMAREDAERIYCKSPSQRGERVVARVVPGARGPGSTTVNGYTQQQSDLLERIQRAGCAVGLQIHLDMCEVPSNPTGYTKILDLYLGIPGTLTYSNLGDVPGEATGGAMVGLPFTLDDIYQVFKITTVQITDDITETQSFNDIYFDLTQKCADVCGAKQGLCEVGIAVSDPVPGASSFSVLGMSNIWFTTDFGVTWAITGANPFVEAGAVAECCLVIGNRWIVFQGNASATYAGRCAVSDNRGAAWAQVDMGGAIGDFVLGVFAADAGNIWAVGSNGCIWYSADVGNSWTQQAAANALTANDLYAVATADGDTVYAVGQNNTVATTTDGGATWTLLAAGPAGSNIILYAVAAMTNYNVLIGGAIDVNNEVLWYTDDGGTTFVNRAFLGSTGAGTRVRDLDAVTEEHIWMIHGDGAANDYFFRSLDGGYSWERWPITANSGLNAVFACDINNAWAAGETYAPSGIGMIQKAYPLS